MKKTFLSFSGTVFILITIFMCSAVFNNPLFAQISKDHNSVRVGDKLVKQQVESVEPGEAGKGIIWDFSSLKTVNDEYSLDYSSAPLLNDSLYIMGYNQFEKRCKDIKAEDLIVGTEHNTMYYYQVKRDSLLLLGHENPVVKLQYTSPYVLMTYPLNYGSVISSDYTTEGLYSGTEPIKTAGTVTTVADAYGKMILPTRDTINPVLRVKTIQTIRDIVNSVQGNEYTSNSGTENTINKENTKTSIPDKQLETYRWYTKGYRYPIFETVRNVNTGNNEILFATSFYYPPQEHLYIETDPENQRILDEMWRDAEDNTNNNQNNVIDKQEKTIDQIITYRTYPNPVENTLYLNYSLTETANITLSLYSIIDGKIYYNSKKQQKQTGDHAESIDCHIMPSGTYILQILIDNQLPITNTIIKK